MKPFITLAIIGAVLSNHALLLYNAIAGAINHGEKKSFIIAVCLGIAIGAALGRYDSRMTTHRVRVSRTVRVRGKRSRQEDCQIFGYMIN